MSQQIIITVDDQAAVTVEANGFKGSGCKAFTQAVEAAIGATMGDKTTPEFHQSNQQGQKASAAR